MNNLSDEQRISDGLSRYAASKISAHKNLWPAIHQQVAPARRSDFAFRLALSTVIVAALLLVFGVGARLLNLSTPINYSAAVVATLTMSNADPDGLIGDAIYPLLTPLTQTQTVNGYTVILRSAYADANVVAISFDVESPTPDRVVPRSINVMGLEDAVYHSYDIRPSPGPISPTIPLAKVRHYVGYAFTDELNGDLASQTLNSITLMPTIELERLPDATAAATIEAGYKLAQYQPQQPPLASFNFKFVVPFHKQVRVAKVNQTVVASGITITLGSLIVTPGAVAFSLKTYQGGLSGDISWFPEQMKLVAGGKQLDSGSGFGRDGEMVYVGLNSAYDTNSDWSLTIPYFSRWVESDNAREQKRGPWVFHFSVPPAR